MSKLYFLIFTIFFLGMITPLKAQKYEVYGKIIDQETSKGIDIATVFLESIGNYTFTNEDGFFNIKFPDGKLDTLTISVQRLGYKRKSVTVSSNLDTIVIKLEPDVRSLPDVYVTGARRAKKLDGKELVEKAIKSISSNYSTKTRWERAC